MERMTLAEYGPGSKFVCALILALAKEGKTAFMVLSLLGLLPWQAHGGVVSDPAHLHVVAIDQDCLDRIIQFMRLCGVDEKTIAHVMSRLDICNLKKDVAAAYASASTYNHGFFNALKATRQDIMQRCKPGETHAVLMSSFTNMCKTAERSLFGTPTGTSTSGSGAGYGSKDLWTMLQGQMAEIQNLYQAGFAHMFWEGHVFKTAKPPPNPNGETMDTLQVHGSGKHYPTNTAANWRIFRETVKHKGKDGRPTEVDQMYLDAKPTFDFLPTGGRGSAGLKSKEYDLTKMLMDLQYQVGGWRP